MCPKQTLNDKVMTIFLNTTLYMAVLERISFSREALWRAGRKLYVLHGGDIVSTYILTDARNALLLLAVTHVRYGMPHGKNKENKAYICLIFFKYNQMGSPGSWSMCRMQCLSLPGGVMFILTIISQISFQRSANGFRNMYEKRRQMMFFDFKGQKVLLRGRI